MNENLFGNNSNSEDILYHSLDSLDFPNISQDTDSNSSLLNLIDQDLLNSTHITNENLSPIYSIQDNNTESCVNQLAIPNVKSEGLDPKFAEILHSRLPRVVAIENASIQYQVADINYPSLSKSFQKCFNSPVLDLLVVVLNSGNLVSFYQGYFSGIPRLATELNNLNGKYWKSLINNNDDSAWEGHYRQTLENFKNSNLNDMEFEPGPVIRCRLRSTNNHQFSQQLNFFFVQPCSFLLKLPIQDGDNHNDFNYNDESIFFVSYINIVRECDTEYALKGSAAASLQKIITTNPMNNYQMKKESYSDTKIINNKVNMSRNSKRNAHSNPNGASNQLTVHISSPAYNNIDHSRLSHSNAPLSYPVVNNQRSDQYSKQNMLSNVPINQRQNYAVDRKMNGNHFISRVDQIQQSSYPPRHHQMDQSSSLQYILENRATIYQTPKQIQASHIMVQQNQIYSNTVPPNHPYYLAPTQSNQSICSLNSHMPRHVMSVIPSDQYFRGRPQGAGHMESVQIATQPIMTVVQPMSAVPNNNSNSYYCNSSPNQILHTPLHINTSMNPTIQFSVASISPYCKQETVSMSQSNFNINNHHSSKTEPYNIIVSHDNWLSNAVLDSDPSSDTLNPPSLCDTSISMEIVEEILQTEEAKSENKIYDNLSQNSEIKFSSCCHSSDSESVASNVSAVNIPQPLTGSKFLTSSDIKLSSAENLIETKVDSPQTKQNSPPNYKMESFKYETLDKFSNNQKLKIAGIVRQHKNGNITENQMLKEIMHYLPQALGSDTFNKNVLEFCISTQQSDTAVDSNPGRNFSHVVQSPEEGPGISPTAQAAQSTTDMEDDKETSRNHHNYKIKEECISEKRRKISSNKTPRKSTDIAINSVSSTTSTGVLEKLLNEHDISLNSDRSNRTPSSLSRSSNTKNQLSLDQLLLDDDTQTINMTNTLDEKASKKNMDGFSRNPASVKSSQSSTPAVSSSTMGVLETLLNQKNPSMSTLRQMSADNILKHSKPSSRQISTETFNDESNAVLDSADKETISKRNSLLISLLNNSTTFQTCDSKTKICTSPTANVSSTQIQPKRRRIGSGASLFISDPNSNLKSNKASAGDDMDIFNFVDAEFKPESYEAALNNPQPKMHLSKHSRKRHYSKEKSVDSDASSDHLSSVSEKCLKAPSVKTKENVILTSLLENRQISDLLPVDVHNHSEEYYTQATTQNANVFEPSTMTEEHIDFDDIKIDDFDIDNLMDLTDEVSIENLNWSSGNTQNPEIINSNQYEQVVPPVYKEVGPIIKSDPIIPTSKQSIIRVSDRNSILLSAIQPAPSSTITVESLDNERQRLLRQQQMQKLSMTKSGGELIGHQLSLDMLSKQMKEVGPNVTVEFSSSVDSSRYDKSNVVPRTRSSLSMSSSSNMAPTYMYDSVSEPSRVSSTPVTQVNHQQVREGLRQLVSNRSAQNRASSQIQRGSSTNLSEMVSQNEYGIAKVSSKNPSNYLLLNQSSSINDTSVVPCSSRNNSYVLEDSLVNDVFELEELVNNKGTPNPIKMIDDSPMNLGSLLTNPKPHHHHPTPHHHHIHPHHHHHVNTSMSSMSMVDMNSSVLTEKHSTTGLLESLLSK